MLLTIILYLLLFLACVMLYLLFAPLRLDIDSTQQLYSFRMLPFFGAQWIPGEFPGSIVLSFFGFHKRINLQQEKEARPAAEQPPRKKKAQKGPRKKISPARIRNVVHSFIIRRWFVTVDTRDMALNGKLVPWFGLASWYTGRSCTINFFGRNVVVLRVENTMFRMLRAFVFVHQ